MWWKSFINTDVFGSVLSIARIWYSAPRLNGPRLIGHFSLSPNHMVQIAIKFPRINGQKSRLIGQFSQELHGENGKKIDFFCTAESHYIANRIL